MKKLAFLLFISSFTIVFAQNQKPNLVAVNSIRFDADEFLGYDSFGFYYTVKNNIFSKIGTRETFVYQNFSLGKITKVDLQNPLKIVLFYENFNTVVTLNNQLNEIQKVNFSESSVPIVVTAIGIASQNQFWIYNSLNQQIGLFDYLNQNYKPISVPLTDSIAYYTSDFNTFYWIDSTNNWYSCDIFGKVSKKGLIPEYDLIVIVNDNQYLYSKNGILKFIDVQKEQKTEIEIAEKSFKKFSYKDQILSIFTAEGITNYKITIP